MLPTKPSPMAGLFQLRKNPDPGLNPAIQDNPEQFPDPNAVMQLQAGVSGTPLFGGAGPRQLGSVSQAQGMISGSNGQAQPAQHSIMRSLWNAGQMTPAGIQKQKAVAPGPAAVNTFAAHAAQQAPAGTMTPPIGATAPGMPGAQDIMNAQVPPQVIRQRGLTR